MDLNSDINDDIIRRVEIERKEINSAYDNGPTADSVDVKLDASLTSKTDRYGFIHDKVLPELSEEEKARYKLEKSREKKWLSMISRWSEHMQRIGHQMMKASDKLTERIFKGIPDSIRNRAWYNLLDIEGQKREQRGVYERMKKMARSYSLELRQIDLDINRTFRDNIAYRQRYCQRQVQLYNVLGAYSIYNTEIGYCQGMSGITALLLMYLSDEESTFWALSELMINKKYSMHGLFKRDFPKLIRLSEKHDRIVETLLPKVFKKFKKCNISSLLYTTKWFLQCFLDTLPFSLVLRIWDIYLLKGDNVILAMSYCILKVHKKQIKKLDMDTINEFLKNQLPNDFGMSDDDAIMRLQECMEELKRLKLDINDQQIPANEIPTKPFGIFDYRRIDKVTKQDLLMSNQKKPTVDQIVEQFKSQTNQLTKQSSLSLNSADEDSLDDDEDDLNPSKISEYDKESVISDLTQSKTDEQSQNSSLNNDQAATLKRCPSDYDNVDANKTIQSNDSNGTLTTKLNKIQLTSVSSSTSTPSSILSTTSNNNSNNKNDNNNNNSRTLTNNINKTTGLKTTIIIDTSNMNSQNDKVYTKYNKNHIMSEDIYEVELENELERSPKKTRSPLITNKHSPIKISASAHNHNNTSIASNATQPPHSSNGSINDSQKNVARIIVHKDNLEFVRGPYGIYTREKQQQQQQQNGTSSIDNLKLTTLNNINNHIRASSLRNVNNTNNYPKLSNVIYSSPQHKSSDLNSSLPPPPPNPTQYNSNSLRITTVTTTAAATITTTSPSVMTSNSNHSPTYFQPSLQPSLYHQHHHKLSPVHKQEQNRYISTSSKTINQNISNNNTNSSNNSGSYDYI